MNDRLQSLFFILLAVFAGLFLLVNVDFSAGRIDTRNWVEYVLIALFYVLLIQFWRMVKDEHNQDVLRAAISDPLSGLFNAQHFFNVLAAEIERSRRRNYPLSMLMVDIDYFDRYNKTHGVKVGDRVLRYVGETVRRGTRSYDVGFRFGNDEFAVVLPETDRIQGRMIGERLRQMFADGFGGELGLSVGVASLAEGDSVDIMLQKAEQAMQEARRSGGNRIRTFIDRGML